MYALTVVIEQAGDHAVTPGSLVSMPVELLTPEQMRRYLAAPAGWSICPLGYSVYGTQGPDGSRIIVPGIIIHGEKKPKRKLEGYSAIFDRKKIENFAKSIVDERRRIEEAAASELQALTHDIRALSAEIYTAADLVKSDIAERHYPAAAFRIETVIAAQQMLSIRLDIVDFSTGQFLEQAPERIPVYKKVHKVINCLKPKSVSQRTELVLQGPSLGFTYGPPIFELVPFVLVQNALKYAPADSEAIVKVSDSGSSISVHVQSLGPKIRASETDRIFDRGFRGVEAQKTGRSGSGLGLFAARALTRDAFGGDIDVIQDNFAAVINDREYYRTTFSVEIPRVA